MWLQIGLIWISIYAINKYFIGRYLKIFLGRWKPQKIKDGYEYSLIARNSRVEEILLGVSVGNQFNFTIKHEVFLDRFFKKLGVSNEIQTGDEEFDNSIYVVSDDKGFHAKLVESTVFRCAIKKLFQSGLLRKSSVEKLECRDGRLWVVLTTDDEIAETNLEYEVIDSIVPILRSLAEELGNLKILSRKFYRERFFKKSFVIDCIIAGMIIYPVSQFLTTTYPFPYFYNNSDLYIHAAILAIILLVMLVLGVVFWMKNSSRAHVVILELLLIGAISSFGSSYYILRYANMHLIDEKVNVIETRLVEYKIKLIERNKFKPWRKKRYYKEYSLAFLDWTCNCSKMITLDVSENIYEKFIQYQKFKVHLHTGYFGYKWVSSIQPVENSQTR
ncbi:MAG: hypothetical protein IPK77_01160 [Cellvibrio sp.]|nr:hypothetical protein [Cellvibrio sp.]